MESTSREKEKAKEKGRWREENGGPVKCRWRVVGRGAVWRGALQFIFSIQRAPPPLLYCPSVWQLELAMWRGEQKRACCPAWVCGHIGRHHISPPPPKKSRPTRRAPRGWNLKQNTLRLTRQFYSIPPKTLKRVIVPSRISCKTKTVSAFGFPLFSWPQYAWQFSRRVLCTLASANIRKLFRTQTLFSLLPARGHANAHGPRGKFF